MISSREAMFIAIEEAKKGFGFVSPNPPVGAVLLDANKKLISKGYHKIIGGAHAEVEALASAPKDKLEGAHLYVTLEPCAHEGKTPSCAKMLAKLPLGSVTYGMIDPNPLVSGKGIEILEAAGLKTEKIKGFDQELEELAEIFLFNIKNKLPFVALKASTSLDGQLMRIDKGQSTRQQWLTGEKTKEKVHELRAHYEAILVGRKTVEIDNPSLNVRHHDYPQKRNKVVVLDPSGQLLSNLKHLNLFKTHKPEDLIWVCTKKVEADIDIVVAEKNKEGMIHLPHLLSELYQRKIYSIFVEGGAETFSQFLTQSVTQRVYLFQAPIVIGGPQGLHWTGAFFNNENMELKAHKTLQLGQDIFTTGHIY